MRRYRDPYTWVDPFEVLDDAIAWVEQREREVEDRARWAMTEAGRQRSLCDQALYDALQKYVPMALEPSTVTILMDSEISSLLHRRP